MSEAFFSCIPRTTTSLNFSEGAKSFSLSIHYLWLDHSKLQKYLYKILAKTLFVGKKLIFLPCCHSTNEVAADLLKKDKNCDGAIVITNKQTAGKGQRGNIWQTEPGKNLTFSLILNPRFLKVADQFNLNMAISLGVQDYLETIGESFLIKWPNDIYFKEKKIGGILIQNTVKNGFIESSIVGIGLNVNQQSFQLPKASSLSIINNKDFDLPEVLEELCHRIEWRYIGLKKGNVSGLRHDYIDNLLGFGEKRKYKSTVIFDGVIQGVSDEGKLQIQSPDGLLTFGFKEVEFL